MNWQDAVREVATVQWEGRGEVTAVEYDSRRVRPGTAFIAMRGETTDGNRYVDAALAQGASAVLTDSVEVYARLRREGPELALAQVEHGRRALSELSAAVLGHPERKLKLTGVTGTNGKTTTAWLLEQMLRAAARKTVLIGTIGTHVGDEVRESAHTTPEASDVLRVFADGAAAGATEAVMEMSSHALDQERVWGLPVDVGIFTNLTQDHLDYHGTMERYAAAKAKLFEGVGTGAPRVGVINVDDSYGAMMLTAARHSTAYAYGVAGATRTGGGPLYRAENIRMTARQTSFEFVTPNGAVELSSRLRGIVNVYNVLAAACAAVARGIALEQIAELAPKLTQVPGRFQIISGFSETGFDVVVDYAHTEDALRNLIGVARELVRPRGGRVITVFGCGGDRDRTKRPKMGRAAAESDIVVLTSDNPRSEDPNAIIEETAKGLRETGTSYVIEPDRAAAIEAAISRARAGDIVLLAGKGHEKTQEIGGRKLPFDDAAVARSVLRRFSR